MQDLYMNLNATKARMLLSMVSGETGVNSDLLLDDSGFCDMIHKLAHSSMASVICKNALIDYVNENY